MSFSPWTRAWDQDAGHQQPRRESDHATLVPLNQTEDSVYPDWDSAYLDNVSRLYRLMYAKVGNRADAEDLTAEVFRAALGPLRLSASKGEVRAYLLATARTVLASHWRRRFGLEITQIDPDTDLAYEPSPATGSDADSRVERVLAGLPENYRRVLELRFLQSCSIKEAATTLGISVSNTKVLQHRALRMAARVAEEQD
jgi:RNA polymerase sigma factor (sigma-70 family)